MRAGANGRQATAPTVQASQVTCSAERLATSGFWMIRLTEYAAAASRHRAIPTRSRSPSPRSYDSEEVSSESADSDSGGESDMTSEAESESRLTPWLTGYPQAMPLIQATKTPPKKKGTPVKVKVSPIPSQPEQDAPR